VGLVIILWLRARGNDLAASETKGYFLEARSYFTSAKFKCGLAIPPPLVNVKETMTMFPPRGKCPRKENRTTYPSVPEHNTCLI